MMTIHRGLPARRGVTLLEVLTAIFIMGVGLLAILTLFPLGALSMARAVRDDRAAQFGANAASWASAIDLRNDQAVATALGTVPAAITGANGFVLLTPTTPNANDPGYPVYVDPYYAIIGSTSLGSYSPGGTTRLGTTTPGLQRVSMNMITSLPGAQRRPAIARWFTFQDEIEFLQGGYPSGNGAINRPGTYTCAFMVRRPKFGTPQLTQLSVIVYANRSLDTVAGETTITDTVNNPIQALGTAGQNGLNVFSGKPNIRKGTWILDTTTKGAASGTGVVNGYFYQVASVTDTGTGLFLELETPLKEDVFTMVVMENVITVLDRGNSWRP
jgi:prepilin-type N-terminal cleavage/methylation domain-containing protein